MKVLLIAPYFEEGLKGFPLGLAYVAGSIKNEYDVYGLDLTARAVVEGRNPEEVLRRELERVKPEIIGITSTSPTHLSAVDTAKIAKQELGNDILVIKGGPHETNTAPTTLKYHPEIDILVIGEGEETIKEVLSRASRSESLEDVLGIAYKNGSEIRVNPRRPLISDIDSIPLPARELFYLDDKVQEYYNAKIFAGRKTATLITSRGCFYNCNFCSSRVTWGRSLRRRSVENVGNEIRQLYSQGYRGFQFVDDNGISDKKWFLRFAESLKQSGMDIQYAMQTRVNSVDERVAKALQESGCAFIYFGIESGVQEVLDRCGKGITIKQAKKAFELTREHGIRAMASVQFGLLGENLGNLSTVRETIRVLNEELRPDEVVVSYTSLYPGSDLANYYGITAEEYEKRINNGVGKGISKKLFHGTKAIHPPELTSDKIREIEQLLDKELKIPRFKPTDLYSE
jgi:radical SAM superfamily enzyme YgiQ (UPF0313 family)